jgi:hypothetical protein
MMTVFWVVSASNLVEFEGRFRGAYSFHHQGDYNVPEDHHFHTRR